MLRPRRLSRDASTINDCASGSTAPSATPIRARATSRPRKPVTSPPAAEKQENRTTAVIRIGLRLPSLSDRRPATSPDSAQVRASTPDKVPSSVLERWISLLMNGARKGNAWRSKKTNPKPRKRISSSRFS
ncbi:hypothetical protein RKD19_008133 [Streptomyces canus]